MATTTAAADKYWVFIGTGGGKLAKGIYRSEFDPATGQLSKAELAAEIGSPGFLALHPNGKFLYCVGTVNVTGKSGGGVAAFALDAKTGTLTPLNQQLAKGSGPCHINVDPSGKSVIIANYGSGSTDAFPIGDDGKLMECSTHVQHKGKSANPKRQDAPHAHSVNITKDGKFAVVADLGLDQVIVYKLDAASGKLEANDPPFCATAPGAGPRHFAFHPNGKQAFVINELDSTLSSLSFDPAKGELQTLKTVSTLPKDFKGNNTTAEVVVHPSGKFVYGSNRGHDSIAAFKFDAKTGDLTFVGYGTEGVKEPRNFNIDPTGQYCIVGSQKADRVVMFKIDQETGTLKPHGTPIEVGAPICIRFIAIAK
jgi:6-phosphogluconolactonase